MGQRAAPVLENKKNLVGNGRFASTTINPMPEQAPMPKARHQPCFNNDFSQVKVNGEQTAQLSSACSFSPTRCPFGGACHTCPVQGKLTIGQPNDKYEQEADRIAEQVMSIPESRVQRQEEPKEEEETETVRPKPVAAQITPLVQRQVESEEEEEKVLQAKPLAGQITPLVQRQVEPEEEDEEEDSIQTKRASGQIPQGGTNLDAQIRSLGGSGRPLPGSERSFFESRFGYDFGRVRIHTGGQAAETARMLKARAFTLGRDIVFGTGEYTLNTLAGKKLLAHELTHVIQQNSTKTKGVFSSVIRREPARTATYITRIFVDLTHQTVSWVYSDGTSSLPHIASTGAGICQNARSVCYSGNQPNTACTPVGGPFPVTGNRSPHRYRHFIDFGRSSIGFHYYRKVDGCPWSHGCVRLREDAIDLLHAGVRTVRQATQARPPVTPTQVWVSGQPKLVRCWTTANGGRCYIRNATGAGRTRQRCARHDCFPLGDYPIPDVSEQATRYA